MRNEDAHLNQPRVKCKKMFSLQDAIHQPKLMPEVKSEERESKVTQLGLPTV
jgi:hypothetical protein